MKTSWMPALGIVIALQAACAHVQQPGDAKTAEKISVTGSHVAQRVDPASGMPKMMSPLGIYSRNQLDQTGRQYDIDVFVRKMERLYDLLHRVSRATKRKGVLVSDLSFLTGNAPV